MNGIILGSILISIKFKLTNRLSDPRAIIKVALTFIKLSSVEVF